MIKTRLPQGVTPLTNSCILLAQVITSGLATLGSPNGRPTSGSLNLITAAMVANNTVAVQQAANERMGSISGALNNNILVPSAVVNNEWNVAAQYACDAVINNVSATIQAFKSAINQYIYIESSNNVECVVPGNTDGWLNRLLGNLIPDILGMQANYVLAGGEVRAVWPGRGGGGVSHGDAMACWGKEPRTMGMRGWAPSRVSMGFSTSVL